MRVTQALCVPKTARIEASVQQLSGWFGKRHKRRRGETAAHDPHRRDIISQDLCNFAVAALRSCESLPEKKTCDIIEVNPGYSTWSKTLHTALKPRRHILVEPEWSVYKDALDPLVDTTNSSYRVAPTLQDAFDASSDLLSAELLAHCKDLTIQQRRSKNHQLILVANLVRRNLYTTTFIGKFAKMFMDQFYRATLDDTGMVHFHQHGLIRLLAWVSEEDRTNLMNTCSIQRTKLTRELEAAYHIRAIVGTGDGHDGSRRRPWYDAALYSTNEVAELASSQDLKLPRSRRQPTPLPDTDVIEPVSVNFDLLRSHPNRPRLVDEFFAAYDWMRENHPNVLMAYIPRRKPNATSTHSITRRNPELNKLRLLLNRLRVAYNHYHRVNALVQQQIGYEKELLDLRKADPDDRTRYQARLEELVPKFREIAVVHKSFFKDDQASFTKAVDDYRLILHRAVPWYARDFEPILCHPDDFYPAQPMALLEFTPKASFVQRINNGDRQITFDYINGTSLTYPSMTVDNLVAKLVGSKDSDVYNEFLSELPSLTDPLHGGYWDLSDVRIRSLAAEQLIDIALVYEAWPYRKPTNDMLADTQRSYRANV